jgi:sucrose-phosphate synthase
MASGVPIIATNIGGITDIITHGFNGLLVKPHDSQGLAEAILRLLVNEDLRKELIQNGLITIQRIVQSKNEFENLLRTMISDIIHGTQ